MEKKKKAPPSSKAPQTRAEHLRQSKGVSFPPRIEGKHAGATIAPQQSGRKG